MSARKKLATRTPAAINPICDTASYFDVALSDREVSELEDVIREKTGFSLMTFQYSMVRAATQEIQDATGIHSRMQEPSWAVIHICKSLGIRYRDFARNAPKLSIAPFIAFAKRKLPNVRGPVNTIQRVVITQQVHEIWNDWLDENCPCGAASHWLCADDFEEKNYDRIIDEITRFNETRPRLVPLRLVSSTF